MNDMLEDYSDEEFDAMMPETLAVMLTNALKRNRDQRIVLKRYKDKLADFSREVMSKNNDIESLRSQVHAERASFHNMKKQRDQAIARTQQMNTKLAKARKAKKKVKKVKKR